MYRAYSAAMMKKRLDPPPKALKSTVSIKQSVASVAYITIVAKGVWRQRSRKPIMKTAPVRRSNSQ